MVSTIAVPVSLRRFAAILIVPLAIGAFAAVPSTAVPVAAQASPAAGTPLAGEAIEIIGLVENPGPVTVQRVAGASG